MTICELIKMGEVTTKECYRKYEYGEFYSGQAYEDWLTLAIRFIESNFPNDKDTIRFREIAEDANGYGNEKLYPLMGILKAFKRYPPVVPQASILPLIEDICVNFNKFDINIRRRYNNRETIKINDEYDLQDAMYSILKLFVKDIRLEDYVPSYAGSNSRVDFFLPEYSVIIETKMASNSLRDRQVGEQLIIDFERYKEVHGCNHLICFVYDKDANISNPNGVITDLEKLSDKRMRITVFISPQ